MKIPSICIWLIDGSGSRSYFQVWAASSHSPLELIANAWALANVLPTSCTPERVTVMYDARIAPVPSPQAESSLRSGAWVLFDTMGQGLQRLLLPGVKEEIFIPGTDEVDKTGSLLTDFLEEIDQRGFTDEFGRPFGFLEGGMRTNEYAVAVPVGAI